MMKRMWRRFPTVVRWLLVTLTIMIIASSSTYAYVALTGEGQVTVKECLSWVGDNTFEVTLYPQEGKVVNLTLANASSYAVDAELGVTVTPDPGWDGLIINAPSRVTVPPNGQTSFNISVVAGKSAKAGGYSVAIEIMR